MLSEAALAQPQSLERHKEQLLCAEPVRAILARQRRVFRPSPLASQFDLPADFFNLTAEEVKREQRLRSEAVERLSVLRTKAMREKEEQREMRKYTYTLLRVRLPDGCLLQGACCPRGTARAVRAVQARPGRQCLCTAQLCALIASCGFAVPPAGAEGLSGGGPWGVPMISSPFLTVLPHQGPFMPESGWPHCTCLSGKLCRVTGYPLNCWPLGGRSCQKTRTWLSTSVGW